MTLYEEIKDAKKKLLKEPNKYCRGDETKDVLILSGIRDSHLLNIR